MNRTDLKKPMSSDCMHSVCSKQLKCKFVQEFTNMETEYHLVDGELQVKGLIDQQKYINSNYVETLTEMYDKYVNGELIPRNSSETGELIDFTQTLGKDKLEMIMAEHNQFKEIISKYNLPETTTPQEFSDYLQTLQVEQGGNTNVPQANEQAQEPSSV